MVAVVGLAGTGLVIREGLAPAATGRDTATAGLDSGSSLGCSGRTRGCSGLQTHVTLTLHKFVMILTVHTGFLPKTPLIEIK